MTSENLSRRTALLLLAALVVGWGFNWIVNKITLQYVPPIWAVVFRTVPACLIYWVACVVTGRLARPVKADLPVIFSVGWLHMVGFSVLVSIGLQYLPAGRSIVLAYTTPLWVLPAARFFLNEPFTLRRTAGLLVGMSGLVLILRPGEMDWTSPDIILGHALVLLAAFSWAISIVYGRAHRWVTPLFELLPWQLLLASITQTAIAIAIEGTPKVDWSLEVVLCLAYGCLIGTCMAYWVMNTVNRGVPASVTSMGLLAVPVFGLLCSAIFLGEHIDASLMTATVLIIAGIVLGTAKISGRRKFQRNSLR